MFLAVSVFGRPKSMFDYYRTIKKVKHIQKLINFICIADITSFNHGKFHITIFYINKVMREEVEPFEWPSYIAFSVCNDVDILYFVNVSSSVCKREWYNRCMKKKKKNSKFI